MTFITTNVKHRVRTTGLEHQGQKSISDPDQNLGFTCIFSSGMQEIMFLGTNIQLCRQRLSLLAQMVACLRLELAGLISRSITFFHYLSVTGERMSTG